MGSIAVITVDRLMPYIQQGLEAVMAGAVRHVGLAADFKVTTKVTAAGTIRIQVAR